VPELPQDGEDEEEVEQEQQESEEEQPKKKKRRGAEAFRWTTSRCEVLLVEAAQMKATSQPWGKGTSVLQSLFDKLKIHALFKDDIYKLNPQAVGRKLNALIAPGKVEELRPESGHSTDRKKMAECAKALYAARETKEQKKKEEKDASSWDAIVSRLSQAWTVASATSSVPGARCTQANLAVVLMKKCTAGNYDEKGAPIIHPAAAWVFDKDIGPAGHPLYMVLTEDQLPSRSPAAIAASAAAANRPKSAAAVAAAAAASDGSESPQSSQQQLVNLLVASEVRAQFCTGAPDCQCRYTQSTLREEGIGLTGSCPVCDHNRGTHCAK